MGENIMECGGENYGIGMKGEYLCRSRSEV